jgi:hypothetical protein
MKVEIEEWHAVSTWTWNAEDDSCGICRRAPFFARSERVAVLPPLPRSFRRCSRRPLSDSCRMCAAYVSATCQRQ